MTEPKEMVVYHSSQSMTGDLAENIVADLRNTFSKFEVEYLSDNNVVARVPKSEMEIAKKLRDDILLLLGEIKKENSVLAGKLARRYGLSRYLIR